MLNRRALIAAGVASAVAPAVVPTRAAAVEPSAGDPRRGVDVWDFAPDDVAGDWTQAFQEAIDLAARGYARVLVPNGTYRLRSLQIPHRVKIVGLGADNAYFGGSGDHAGGVNLDRIDDGSDVPMLTVTGPGVTIESLTLRGRGVRAPLLHVRNGFESMIRTVRAVDCPTTAVLVDQLNNSLWEGLFINDSGSASEAAMVIRSPSETGTNTNAVKFVHLTIEGSANVALDIAWGTSPGAYAEFLRFVTAHIEAESESEDAVIRVGNVRSVQFDDPFVYGGPGRPLVEYRHARFSGVEIEGGVRFVGGTLLGVNRGRARSPHLVRLIRGNDVSFIGCRMGQFDSSAIRVDPEFGPDVTVDGSCFVQGYRKDDGSFPPLFDDRRTAAMTVTAGSANLGAAARIDGSPTHGIVAFDVVSNAPAGSMALVRFPAAFTERPVVHLTPLSAPTASAAPWTYVSERYFLVSFANRPSITGTSGMPYQLSYRVERARR